MTNQPRAGRGLFKLQEVSSQGDGVYSIKLVRDGEVVATECTVSRITETTIESLDVVRFKSEKFNNLCAHGDIYLKPIGKVILAFHECLQERGDLT
jgi:hypothetical protein